MITDIPTIDLMKIYSFVIYVLPLRCISLTHCCHDFQEFPSLDLDSIICALNISINIFNINTTIKYVVIRDNGCSDLWHTMKVR